MTKEQPSKPSTKADDQHKGPSSRRFWIITSLYVLIVGFGSFWLGFFDPNGDPIIPDHWGSVLSGVFSPLAFLWLVYASLSQKAELELQRNELKQNNKSQEDQFKAMQSQAEALAAQVELMKVQAEDLARRREQEIAEADVWSQWYLHGLQETHHQLIDYTAHLGRDIKTFDSAEKAERAYRIDDLQGVLHAEAGLPKVHYLATETQAMVLDLLGFIARQRRAADNYVYLARKNGGATEDDIKGYCNVVNILATKAYKAGVEGLQILQATKVDSPR